jgi:methyl-accepting chemotaxis protein
MRNLSIKQQLAYLIGFAFILSVIIGIFQIRSSGTVSKGLDSSIVSAQVLRNHMEGDMMHDGLRADVLAALYDASKGGASKKENLASVKDHAKHFREMIKENEGLPLSPATRVALGEVKPALDAYIASAEKIASNAYANYTAGAAAYPAFIKDFEVLEDRMAALSDTIEKDSAGVNSQAKSSSSMGLKVSVAATLAMGLFAIGALWVLGSRIAKRAESVKNAAKELESCVIGPLTDALHRLADGDLAFHPNIRSVRMNDGPRDEISAAFESMADRTEEMVKAYDAARASLSDAIGQMRAGADKLSDASRTMNHAVQMTAQTSDEIALGSESLAETTSGTARSIDQLNDSIVVAAKGSAQQLQTVEESLQALNSANDALEEVNRTAQLMASNASKGSDAVAKTISAMESISNQADQSLEVAQVLKEKGKKIGSIVNAIEDVAAQTNLLSLNASIEAARAGEHGKGFAVVADEVRKLSQEASNAAKEIGTLIADVSLSVNEVVQCFELMQKQVAQGSAQTMETGSVLDTIVESINQTVEKILEVSTQANETSRKMVTLQTIAAEGNCISNEMREIANIVAQGANSSAAVSEESSACADELRSSTHQLASAAAELESVSEGLRQTASKFVTEETTELRLAA